MSAEIPTPALAYVCDIDAEVGPIVDLGAMPHGRRRIIGITGGKVRGRIAGSLMPGGADWQHARGDGVLELTARYAIRTDDGVDIAVTNRGMRRAPAEVMAALSRGEPVDPGLVYFRTAPVLEAPTDSAYAWLNGSIFVGSAQRRPQSVHIRVFEVL
ncbi:MAG: DUF3237 domain-containing protein [Hyphomicrobiaceae bacterium]|nr:DUF3237 domain-containing protein [Hyphomicrobiaceae bacterium]